jgi:DNA-binding NarL/FixJ family response regulator
MIPYEELSDEDKRTLRSIIHQYNREGYSIERIMYLTDRDEAVKLREQGLSDIEISGKLGIPDGRVHKLLDPRKNPLL